MALNLGTGSGRKVISMWTIQNIAITIILVVIAIALLAWLL
jgi:hypothetical protein